jgi:hypothetical protein
LLYRGARERAREEALGRSRASMVRNEGEVKDNDNEAE